MNRPIGRLFILGDSYSTFEGHIPEGFAPYYTSIPHTDTDVTKVEQTWWHIFVRQTKAALVRNCSWSGTTICNTGYDGCDNSNRSFIARLDRLLADGFFNSHPVDTLLVFGGTNDAWSNAPLGEYVRHGWTKEDLYAVYPAVFYLADRLKNTLPEVRCVFVLNCDIKDEVTEVLKAACDAYGFAYVMLHDIDKTSGHPTVRGMAQIAEQLACLAE